MVKMSLTENSSSVGQSPIRQETQSEAILGMVEKNHAWSKTARRSCVVDGCRGDCHGWLTSGELHSVGMSARSRLAELRNDGWIIDYIEKENPVDGIFHFVRQVPVQLDLETGKPLRYLGKLPVGVEGKAVEFFEIGK